MISLKIFRSDLRLVQIHFFPYITMAKTTRIKNAAHLQLQSPEHLTVLAVNCITDEIMLHINRKIIVTTGTHVKLKFTGAQAVIFMQLLNNLPVNRENFYLWNLRNWIVELLDKQIIAANIYEMGKVMNS